MLSVVRNPQSHIRRIGVRLGRRAVLMTGVRVESKAVHHYAQLLTTIDWDNDTRRIIEKNQADEDGHISRWKSLLAAAAPIPTEA
jgi:hypothetical protein